MLSEYLWPPPPSLEFWIPHPIFMKLGMQIMALEPIWTAYFISLYHQSVYVCVSLLSLLDSGLVNPLPRQRIHSTVEELLYASVCISLLGNNLVQTFPRQRRIVGGVVLCAVHVMSRESRRLILPRTSWYFWRLLLRREHFAFKNISVCTSIRSGIPIYELFSS
jgi:hypothetical protein